MALLKVLRCFACFNRTSLNAAIERALVLSAYLLNVCVFRSLKYPVRPGISPVSVIGI